MDIYTLQIHEKYMNSPIVLLENHLNTSVSFKPPSLSYSVRRRGLLITELFNTQLFDSICFFEELSS